MKHPNTPNQIEVEPERVALYAASGWVAVPEPDPEPTPEPGPDPSAVA